MSSDKVKLYAYGGEGREFILTPDISRDAVGHTFSINFVQYTDEAERSAAFIKQWRENMGPNWKCEWDNGWERLLVTRTQLDVLTWVE